LAREIVAGISQAEAREMAKRISPGRFQISRFSVSAFQFSAFFFGQQLHGPRPAARHPFINRFHFDRNLRPGKARGDECPTVVA